MIGTVLFVLAAATTGGTKWPEPPLQAPWSDYWGREACKRVAAGETRAAAFEYVMVNQILGSRWEGQMIDFVKKYGPQEKWSEIATHQMMLQVINRCPAEPTDFERDFQRSFE